MLNGIPKLDDVVGQMERQMENTMDKLTKPLKVKVAEILKAIPLIRDLFDDFIKEHSDGKTPIRVEEAAAAIAQNPKLSEAQRTVVNYANEGISFWNENLPNGVPSLPAKIAVIMLGMAEVESGLNPTAVHRGNGAKGLTQFIESTWRDHVRLYGPTLVQKGFCTQEELNNPNARTENPRLVMAMTTRYIVNSYQKLTRAGLLPNGWDTPDLGYKLYICHGMGLGDGPKWLRAQTMLNPSAARDALIATMTHNSKEYLATKEAYARDKAVPAMERNV